MPGPAYLAGLKPGDEIISADGNEVSTWMDFRNIVLFGSGRIDDKRLLELKVARDINGESKILDLQLHPEIITREEFRSVGLYPEKSCRWNT